MVDFTWLVGGPQGSGVDTGAVVFSRACAAAGYQIFGKREFHSNIKGEHSYFEVRVSDHTIRSNTSHVDMMVSYDPETVFRHYSTMSSGGVVVYDSDMGDAETTDVKTMDAYFRERLDGEIRRAGVPPTVNGVLEIAARRGVRLYPVSFQGLLADLAREQDNPKLRSMRRMYNVLGVSLSAGLVGMNPDRLTDAVRAVFVKKQAVADLNAGAAIHSYNRTKAESVDVSLPGTEKRPGTSLVMGHQGTALGKMVAGCRFQSYYPITPASDESVYLESNDILKVRNDRPGSISVVQTEDEISAIGMMIGAALTGTRSSTCTSGPGFSLMAEALGWAGINEVSAVITLYQRSGPSTGLPTRHGQDDLLFAVFAGHGEFPRIVYASGDIEESFYDTGLCFNYSDIYQIPVIHLMDKFLSSATVTCPSFDPSKIRIERGKLLQKGNQDYKRFQLGGDGISPRSYLGLKDGIFWTTGDESDETGHITEDPVLRRDMMDKRYARLKLVQEQIPEEEQAVSHAVGDCTIVSWGSTKGPILDALEMLKAENVKVGFVQIKMLHPFPADLVGRLLKDATTIVDIESNQTAQLGKLFRQNMSRNIDKYVLKYTGRAMTCDEIRDALKDILSGKAPEEQVLMHGP